MRKENSPLFVDKIRKKYYKTNQGEIISGQFESVVPIYLENFQIESKECYEFL